MWPEGGIRSLGQMHDMLETNIVDFFVHKFVKTENEPRTVERSTWIRENSYFFVNQKFLATSARIPSGFKDFKETGNFWK